MTDKMSRNEDAALLEVDNDCPENPKTPLLNDMIVFGPKIESSNETYPKNKISSKIHVCNVFFSIVLIVLGMLNIAGTILACVKMGSVAKYHVSMYIFSIAIGILLIIAGSGSIRMKLNNMYSKYLVIFLIAIDSGCLLVFLLAASHGFQEMITHVPYSFYSKILLGCFIYSVLGTLSLMSHLAAIIKYIK